MRLGYEELRGIRTRISSGVLALVIGLAMTCATSLVAFAQLDVTVDIGFNGRFVSDHFTPVSVHLKYQGPAFQGELELSQEIKPALGEPASISQRYPINMGSNVDRVVEYYFPVSRISAENKSDPILKLSIWVDGKRATEREITISEQIDREAIVLVVSEVGSRRTLLTDERVEFVTIDDLPQDWRGLDGVSKIYFGRANTNQLSPRQERAIEQWVMAGGELVVLSGENFLLQDSDWLRHMVPFEVDEIVPRSESMPAIAQGNPTGNVVFEENNHPILIEQDNLNGSVFFATIDLMPRGEIEDRAWGVLEAAVRRDKRIDTVGGDLLNSVKLVYPEKLVVGLWLVLYLGAFGYFTLWILKQPTSSLRRSMLDMPEEKKHGGKIIAVLLGIIVFFTVPAVAYLSQPSINSKYYSVEIGMVIAESGLESGWNRNWYSVVTKRDASIELPIGSDSMIAPLGQTDLEVDFGAQATTIKFLPYEIDHWTTKHLFTEQLIPFNIGFRTNQGEPNVRSSVFEVYNNSHWHLNDVVLYRNGVYFPIGDLPSDTSLSLAEPSLVEAEWPILPEYQYQYSNVDSAKALLIAQPEVTSMLEQSEDQWMILGWIGNDHIGTGSHELRTSLKLVMIREGN